MESIVLLLILIAAVAVLANKVDQKKTKVPSQYNKKPEYSYRKADALFTPAERSFLGVLEQAVGDEAKIFGKVRVADVLIPWKYKSKRERLFAFNKISRKHFDYVLCDNNDLSILCVIELNDKSHNWATRKKRDLFLSEICKDAGIPFLQVRVRAGYQVNEVADFVLPYIRKIRKEEKPDIASPSHVEPPAIKESLVAISPKSSSTAPEPAKLDSEKNESTPVKNDLGLTIESTTEFFKGISTRQMIIIAVLLILIVAVVSQYEGGKKNVDHAPVAHLSNETNQQVEATTAFSDFQLMNHIPADIIAKYKGSSLYCWKDAHGKIHYSNISFPESGDFTPIFVKQL